MAAAPTSSVNAFKFCYRRRSAQSCYCRCTTNYWLLTVVLVLLLALAIYICMYVHVNTFLCMYVVNICVIVSLAVSVWFWCTGVVKSLLLFFFAFLACSKGKPVFCFSVGQLRAMGHYTEPPAQTTYFVSFECFHLKVVLLAYEIWSLHSIDVHMYVYVNLPCHSLSFLLSFLVSLTFGLKQVAMNFLSFFFSCQFRDIFFFIILFWPIFPDFLFVVFLLSCPLTFLPVIWCVFFSLQYRPSPIAFISAVLEINGWSSSTCVRTSICVHTYIRK